MIRSSLLGLVALGLLGCSSGGDAPRATMGTSADTAASAVAEMQQGSPALENEIQGPGAMNLGMEVMGAVCNGGTEDVAYCQGSNYVECDLGAWKSIPCGDSPQYCGELYGTVGCYSQMSNDPEPGPDPVDAATSGGDAGTPMCPMADGVYDYVSVTGDGCGPQGAAQLEQHGCDVAAVGGPFDSLTFAINADGTQSNCAMSMQCFTVSGAMITYRQDPCTWVYMRR